MRRCGRTSARCPEEVDLAELYPLMAELTAGPAPPGALDAAPAGAHAPGLHRQPGLDRQEPKGVVLVISPWNYPF